MRRAFAALLALILVITAVPVTALAAYDLPYVIAVDITNQIVSIYKADDGTLVRQMICSSGQYDNTPLGTFRLPEKNRDGERTEWFYFIPFRRWGHYPTRITGAIMFHSLPYYEKDESTLDTRAAEALGTPASHGCIRLRADDAEFIALNCAVGTKCKIYKSGERNEELREALLESTYSIDSGLSFEQYFGISEDPDVLGRGAKGAEVENLQYRLRALGFYGGEITGAYGSDTVKAVKEAQRALGMTENGMTDALLSEVLFSADAPTTMNVELTEGTSGPVIRAFQRDLAVLGLYEGDQDGVYDTDVIDAVARFQTAYGYASSESAKPNVQKAVRYEAERVAAFFEGTEYTVAEERFGIDVAVVGCETRLRLIGTDGSDTGRVANGAVVFPIEVSQDKVLVQYNGSIGCLSREDLKGYHLELSVLTYTGGGRQTSVGHTEEAYRTDAVLPAEAFRSVLAAEIDRPVTAKVTAVVTLNGVAPRINLRAEPNADAEILDTLEDGTRAEVISRDGEWTRVRVDELTGYLMSGYLTYGAQPVTEELAEDTRTDGSEVLIANTARDASVYDTDADDAAVIGHVSGGHTLEVIETDDDWSLVRSGERQGYMYTKDLSFVYETQEDE